MSHRLLLFAVLCLVAVAWPSAASAGTYDVWSCWAGSDSFRNPSANGSAWGKTGDPGGRYGAFDQCGGAGNGMGVIAYSGFQAPNRAVPGGNFRAPSGPRHEGVRGGGGAGGER